MSVAQKGQSKPLGSVGMNAKSTKKTPLRISHFGNQQVVLETEDYDRFVRSQPEIVRACQHHESMMSSVMSVQKSIDSLINQIKAWCAGQPRVARCVLIPRADDVMIAVVATDEDPGGTLHGKMCDLHMDIFENNDSFQLYFVLFRASESDGVSAFGDSQSHRVIYSADNAGTRKQSKE